MNTSTKKKRVSKLLKPSNNLSPMSSLSQIPNNHSPLVPILPPGVPGELSGESKTNAWLEANQEELGQISPRPSNSLSPMSSLGRNPNNNSPTAPVLPQELSGVPLDLSGENKTENVNPEIFNITEYRVWLKTNQGELGNSKNKDFTSKVLRIGNLEQRKVYKAEFNKNYNRYMSLHAKLDGVSQRVGNLQMQLRYTPETSPDHLLLRKMVIKEYQAANTNQIKQDREEFQYLHKKLDHIKKLVRDYDTNSVSSMLNK